MKKIIQLICIVFVSSQAFAQQWIDETYEYDSIMNLEYGTAENFLGYPVALHMDLYLPICESSSGDSKTPLAIFIHGGSFIAGDKGETTITDLAKSFAKRGYAAASINYRMGFVNDAALNQCNFPNYSCFFAADSAEWYRAYYRAVQDGKGALRFLVNHAGEYQIDPNNIFVSGESAGAFIAMGVGFLDVASEKFTQAYELNSVLTPNFNTLSCPHNLNQTFPNATILRPDLGSIDGDIEPTSFPFTIKGVGNFYGGMISDLLALNDITKPKPAIYQFHQPCDLIVPFETGRVYAGQNWCFTNGYGCSAIANSAMVYGSKRISDWNTNNAYGYTIQDNFTTIPFPYEYIGFQPKNCYDQVVNGNGCHAYDNYVNRKSQLVSFFAPIITTTPICTPGLIGSEELSNLMEQFTAYPNPFTEQLTIESPVAASYSLTDLFGRTIQQGDIVKGSNTLHFDEVSSSSFSDGVYFLRIATENEQAVQRVVRK